MTWNEIDDSAWILGYICQLIHYIQISKCIRVDDVFYVHSPFYFNKYKVPNSILSKILVSQFDNVSFYELKGVFLYTSYHICIVVCMYV